MQTKQRTTTRFSHFSTTQLLNLTASPYQTTDIGTDYGHRMDIHNVDRCEAHQALWKRQAKHAQRALIAHQSGLQSWDDFLDAEGVPPIPDAYWDAYYAVNPDLECPF